MAQPADFPFAAFYYPELLDALIRLKRQQWPEHTEENPHDPVIQLMRLYAIVGHTAACRLDHTARELFLDSLQLRSSMIALGRLVDYRLAPPVPSEGDVLGDLTAAASAGAVLLRARSIFANDGDGAAAVVFEYASDTAIELTADTGDYLVAEDDGGIVTDVSAGLPLSLWGGTPVVGDALYLGHPDLMFNRVGLEVSVAAAGTTLRWGYYDPAREGQPDTVSSSGGGIRFRVSTVVGDTRATGVEVTITCLRTGVAETVSVAFGSYNYADTSLLGQVSMSPTAGDYLVTCSWPELPDLTGTTGLTADTTVGWTLPQDADRAWGKTSIADVEGYYVQVLVVAVSGPTAPTLATVSEPRKTTWTVLAPIRQGRRYDDRLGTSTGAPSQAFTLPREPFLSLDEVTVDGEGWERQDNLLASAAYDRHFTLLEQPDGAWVVTFGDGTTGKIPPATAEIRAAYRVGGDVSGDLGAGLITRDRSGNTRLKNLRNPRAMSGWVATEASTVASMNTARAAIPASLRTLGRAVTPDDAVTLATAFRTADGTQVAARAQAIEEGAGPKTLQLVCVAPGGAAPTAADLAELEVYFNGEAAGLQRLGGVMVSNQEAVPVAFTPHGIDVDVTITVLADYVDATEARVEAVIGALISPLAMRQVIGATGTWEQGTTYQWEWGSTVSRAVLFGAIATALEGVINITITSPAADVVLADDELPVLGSLSVTVVS